MKKQLLIILLFPFFVFSQSNVDCEKEIIEKNRYYHKLENHIIEVDEFLGKNKGLIVAEIELRDKNEPFVKPDYFGTEVTNNSKYYNSNLSLNPFKNWIKKTGSDENHQQVKIVIITNLHKSLREL